MKIIEAIIAAAVVSLLSKVIGWLFSSSMSRDSQRSKAIPGEGPVAKLDAVAAALENCASIEKAAQAVFIMRCIAVLLLAWTVIHLVVLSILGAWTNELLIASGYRWHYLGSEGLLFASIAIWCVFAMFNAYNVAVVRRKERPTLTEPQRAWPGASRS